MILNGARLHTKHGLAVPIEHAVETCGKEEEAKVEEEEEGRLRTIGITTRRPAFAAPLGFSFAQPARPIAPACQTKPRHRMIVLARSGSQCSRNEWKKTAFSLCGFGTRACVCKVDRSCYFIFVLSFFFCRVGVPLKACCRIGIKKGWERVGRPRSHPLGRRDATEEEPVEFI